MHDAYFQLRMERELAPLLAAIEDAKEKAASRGGPAMTRSSMSSCQAEGKDTCQQLLDSSHVCACILKQMSLLL